MTSGWNFIRKLEIPFAIFLVLIVNVSYQKTNSTSYIKTFITPPKDIQFFHFGQNLLMADLLWIRWIQNIDQCDAVATAPVSLNPTLDDPDKKCFSGWGSQMLDRITLLDPQFYSPYLHGAMVTSVIIADQTGIDEIFQRGIKNFPKDWQIPYRAAYNAQYVLEDKAKAADYLSIAGRNGAPLWVHSAAARLYSEDGEYDLGIRSLEELLEQTENPEYKIKVERRLKDLMAKKAAKSQKKIYK